MEVPTKGESNVWHCWDTYRDTRRGCKPLPSLELRPCPPLNINPYMGILMDGMGVLTLDPLAEGNEVTDDIPHIEKTNALGMDGGGLIPLIEGKEDTIKVPPPPPPPRRII
jgi:hypothetical protein